MKYSSLISINLSVNNPEISYSLLKRGLQKLNQKTLLQAVFPSFFWQ